MNKHILAGLISAIVFLGGCTPSDFPSADPITEISDSTTTVGFFDTRISSYWITYPLIKICPNAGVSKERVRQAVSFWQDVGYRFGGIELIRATGEPCSALPGEIAFKVPTQKQLSEAISQNRLAVTETSYDRPTRQIIMANIFFQTQIASHKEKVVEHELGHALGWSHHNRASHIMHPNLEKGGLSRIGMEKRDYEARIRDLLRSIEAAYHAR